MRSFYLFTIKAALLFASFSASSFAVDFESGDEWHRIRFYASDLNYRYGQRTGQAIVSGMSDHVRYDSMFKSERIEIEQLSDLKVMIQHRTKSWPLVPVRSSLGSFPLFWVVVTIEHENGEKTVQPLVITAANESDWSVEHVSGTRSENVYHVKTHARLSQELPSIELPDSAKAVFVDLRAIAERTTVSVYQLAVKVSYR